MSVGGSRLSIGISDLKPGRMSLSMSRRNSSIGMGITTSIPRSSIAGSGVMKDPRNFSDKTFMNNSIRSLIKYLTEHNYDHPISPKLLSRPAVKDFNNIIMFLFRQFDPNFSNTGKFEDDVITMLKHLGYPSTINKSTLTAVGTQHAWPPLLACLAWLVELLGYDEAVALGQGEEDREFDMDDPASADKCFYAYLTKAYSLFMSGEDERFYSLERNFLGNFETRNNSISEQVRELTLQNDTLAREITEAESRKSVLPELEEKKKGYQKDLFKFEQLIDQLERHREQFIPKTEMRQAELAKVNAALATVREDVQSLKKRVDMQEISAEDVVNMQTEHARLEESQQAASEARQDMQRRVWASETALRDKVQALDDAVRTYNGTLEDLKLNPDQMDRLAIDVDIRAKKRTSLMKTDVRNEVLPALQVLRAQFVETTSKLRSELMISQDLADECDQQTSEAQEEIILLEGKCRRTEENFKREKELHEQASSRLAQDVAQMESRLRHIRDTSQEETRASNSSRIAGELRALRETKRNEHACTKKEIIGAIIDSIAMCANHREMVQQQLGDLKIQYSQKLEGLLMENRLKQQKSQQIISSQNLGISSNMNTKNRTLPPPSPVIPSTLGGGTELSILRSEAMPPHPPQIPIVSHQIGGNVPFNLSGLLEAVAHTDPLPHRHTDIQSQVHYASTFSPSRNQSLKPNRPSPLRQTTSLSKDPKVTPIPTGSVTLPVRPLSDDSQRSTSQPNSLSLPARNQDVENRPSTYLTNQQLKNINNIPTNQHSKISKHPSTQFQQQQQHHNPNLFVSGFPSLSDMDDESSINTYLGGGGSGTSVADI